MTKLGQSSDNYDTAAVPKNGQICETRKLAWPTQSQTSDAFTQLLATKELLQFLGPIESNFGIFPPKKSACLDIFLRATPHHASQAVLDWVTFF